MTPVEPIGPKLAVFLEDYIPHKLVVREKQVNQIEEAIANFEKSGIAPNLLLQGFTGSGKTSTLQYTLRNYDKNRFIFVKCKQQRGIKEVIAQIGDFRPLARQRAPELLPRVIEYLKKNKKIIILDDVTAVSSYPELLGYMDGIYREVPTPIFVTTNVFQFLEKLADDVSTHCYSSASTFRPIMLMNCTT